MRFFEQLFLSFKYYGETFRFIDRHNLYGLLIIPAILGLGVTLFVAWIGWKTSESVIAYLMSIFSFRELTGFWGDLVEVVFRFVIRLLTLFLYLKIFRYLLLVILSPSFIWISKRIQAIQLGDKHTSIPYFRSLFRCLGIALFNFIRDILYTGLVILVALIVTFLAPLAPFAIFFVESYFYGYAMMDYRNQFLHKSVIESRKVIHHNIGLTLGNGICFNLILLVPLFGVMLSPVLALIAAGISIDEVEKESNEHAIG